MREAAPGYQKNVQNSLLAAALFSGVLLLIYFGTTASMVAIWSRSDTFAHGFLVLPITLWLIWIRREHLLTINPQPELRVSVLMLAPAAAWLLAWMVDVDVVQQLALVTMIILGCWVLMGGRIARLLAFPLLFLFFAVPMGEGLIPPMMEFTADSTIWLIKLTGIPVYREGLNFSLPSGAWSVVEACSGVRYIIASVTVGTLYAYLTYRSTSRRLVFVLVSLIMPVFANTLRAFIIVMLGHFSGMTIATGADHLVYGWVFFGLVIFLLFWLGSFFREDELAVGVVESADGAIGGEPASNATMLLVAFLVVLIPAAIGPLMAYRSASEAELNTALDISLPIAQGSWASELIVPWYWKPPSRVAGKARTFYRTEAGPLELTVQYDDGTRYGADVLGSSTFLIEWRSGSLVAEQDHASVQIGGQLFVVDQAVITGVDDDMLVWSWYNVGGFSTKNAYLSKLLQARARLGVGTNETYRIVLATPVQDGSKETTQRYLQDFLDQHGEQLYVELLHVRERLRE